MTRKDYKLIAASITDTRKQLRQNGDDIYGLVILIANLSTALSQTNPRFDRDKFIAACEAKETSQ